MNEQLELLNKLSADQVWALFQDMIETNVDLSIRDYAGNWQSWQKDKRLIRANRVDAEGRFAEALTMRFNRAVLADVMHGGRLDLTEYEGRIELSYTAGQSYPHELHCAIASVLRRYNQRMRPKPDLVHSPELDDEYLKWTAIKDLDEQKAYQLSISVPFYVHSFDVYFEDIVVVPALSESEVDAICRYMDARGDQEQITYGPARHPASHLIFSWRWHAHDVPTPKGR